MEDGSLYALLRELKAFAVSRFARDQRKQLLLTTTPKWRRLHAGFAWISTTSRALSLCVMPILSCVVGNALLFSGQGGEFLREYTSYAYRVQVDLRLLADPRIAWLFGLSIWAVATWYVARQLLSRLYLGDKRVNERLPA